MQNKIDKLKQEWESYIFNGEPSKDTRTEIKEAWDRCIKMGINYNDGYGQIISEDKLEKKLEKNKKLIEIASPIMKNIFEIINKTSFSLILTDNEGVLLHIIESENIHFKHNSLNFVLGTMWDEKNVGANAIGTALARNRSIHMMGPEHFCKSHHLWTCSAALIHNSLGEVIACINISGSVEDSHIHTFGIVTTASNIIEKQLDLLASNELLKVSFNSILDGLLVFDNHYKVTNVNNHFLRIIGLNFDELMTMDIKEVFKDIDIDRAVLLNGENIRLSDYIFNINNQSIECLITISPTVVQEKVIGAVVYVKEAIHVRKVVSQLAGYKSIYTFDDILTKSSQMMKLIQFTKKISKSDTTVLIQGESGTGKELFAHSIHESSRRKDGTFIPINCAALPKDLVESELFGYEKGAFTGALKDGKPGKFELANNGTIFLDEIGELPLDVQAKLLRIIENQKVNRIGSTQERNLNVRIIAATNRNLRDEVNNKRFREDLYYRLNVINLKMIPLRKRREDIIYLAEHFLADLNSIHHNEKYFSETFKNELKKKLWNGNVRELRYHIEREYFIADDETINVNLNTLNPEIEEHSLSSQSIKEVEKSLILNALERNNGNVVKAAQELKIGKSTLYRKIQKLNIK